MCLVTKIAWISRSRAQIYLNDDPCFILSAADIQSLGLCEGEELTEGAIRDIYDNIMVGRARAKALDLLKTRDYTSSELYARIKRAFGSDALAEQAVDYVKSFGYIDDVRFAKNYIRGHADSLSCSALAAKLHSKGLSREIIDAAMAEADIDELSQLRQLAVKKFPDYAHLPPDQKRKAVAYFLRRGYAYEDVRTALREL